MKFFTTKVICTSLSLLMISFIPNVSALSCTLPVLGDSFEKSDYVIHGRVSEKNYLTWSLQKPMVTFDVLESFKGNAYDDIIVSVNENWDYTFEEGFEYVIFVQRTELSLEIDPCSPKFLAFPSVVNIVRQVSEGKMLLADANTVFESLTEQELSEYEKIHDSIQEKKIERWDNVTSQRQMMTFSFLLLIPITAVSAFAISRRRK